MKPHKYMKLRGNKWYIIRKVPADISHSFPKKQIWKSLKTSDLQMAHSRYPKALAEIEAEFELAKVNSVINQPASLNMMDIDWIAKTWFDGRNQVLNDEDIGFDSASEKIRRINEIDFERTMWLEEDVNANAAALQSIADKILIATGLPKKPLSKIDLDLGRKNPYQANVDKSEEKYHRFVQLIRRGLIELCERELELLGVKVERSHLINLYRDGTNLSKGPIVANIKSIPVGELAKKFILRYDVASDPSHLASKRASLQFLLDSIGEATPIHMLKREHLNELRDKLKLYPANAKKSKASKDMSFEELIQHAKKHNLKCLSVATIKKRLATIQAFTKWAAAEGYIEKDVCANLDMIGLKDTEAKKNKRSPFSASQLKKLFKSDPYLNPKKPSPAMYWAPIFSLLHGCRLEEILQLKASDFAKCKETDIEYFRIHNENGNKVKTSSAVRTVPLHSSMKPLGLSMLLANAKKNKDGRLFAELNRGSDGSYRKPFSPKFRRLSEKIGIYTSKTTFHSFRHNFADAAKNGGVLPAVLNQLIGWSQTGMHGVYGDGYDLATLAEAMKKIEYPNLDLSHLYPKA